MPIKIKKGRGKEQKRPAPVKENAPKAKTKAKPTMADRLREALLSDPRYIASKGKPIEKRGVVCEFCKNVYIVPCDAEEKEFCLNFLVKTGVIKSVTEWSEKGYADKCNQLKLARHAERKKKGEA